MQKQVDWKLVGEFEEAIVQSQKNGTCLYPGCTEKPIGSHVIARKTLRLIAENRPISVFLTKRYLDFAHFKLKSRQHAQGERGRSVEVK